MTRHVLLHLVTNVDFECAAGHLEHRLTPARARSDRAHVRCQIPDRRAGDWNPVALPDG
jgi:hypothetical protein